MTRYLPIAFGVLLIVGLTYAQVLKTDRLSGANVTAEQRAELLKSVPDKIGDWHGTDMPIDEAVKQTAGAVGAVSRQYRNIRTGEVVDLWLIVGHGRAISAHTPDVCYRSSGFSARALENSPYPMEMEDGTSVPFLTNTFFREDVTGRRLIRVFWTWYNTENNAENVVWEAPTNARWYFGNTRALYKMYFTSQMRNQMETSDQSPCLQFAREFLPVVEKALSGVYGGDSKPTDAAKDDAVKEKSAEETAPKAAESEETPADAAAEKKPAEEAAAPTAEAVPAEDAPSTE